MSRVFNKSTVFAEKATLESCPRCRGAGALSADKGNVCNLCKGDGKVWLSTEGSGWLRRKFRPLEESTLY